MPQRPSSGASTRSRRDEVWEIKRQRWLAKQRGGSGSSAPQQRRPPQLADMSGHSALIPPAPKSPLSRLVAEGYPHSQQQVSTHQPYGEKPNSRGSGTPSAMRQGGGFDAGVAGQWNSNVQHDVMNRQSRHDPGVAGPARPMGGQRVTQPSGGNANIDLSWGGQPAAPSAAAQPPRMPGSGGGGGGPPMGAYHSAAGASPAHVDARYGRNPSPSNASRGGGCPFGRDDGQMGPTGRAMPLQRDAPPFGVDSAPAGGAVRASSRGARGASPAPMQQCGGFYAGGDMGAAGARGRGGVQRPPGGASSVVFG